MLSFIIPALNEEDNIKETIESIRTNLPGHLNREIIVVDNGSVDGTCNVSISLGAKVLKNIDNIGALRNFGVVESIGDVLVFLDADVSITKKWGDEIDSVYNNLIDNPLQITGSRCAVENSNEWFARYWFSLMRNENSKYMNSGHMITTSKLFNKVGGFDPTLRTAEDVDFSLRALRDGATIINNPNLKAIHRGYPSKIKDYILREKWHGYEDFKTIRKIAQSRQAIVSVFNLLLLLVTICLAAVQKNALYFIVYFGFMYAVSLFVVHYKFGDLKVFVFLNSAVICYLYITGRTLALIDRLYSSVIRILKIV